MTLRIGFLGAGFISRTHRWFLRRTHVDHRIVAVHDPDPARAAHLAERTGAEVVDEDRLLDSVDVVFVTTWTSEHERLVLEAARRGVAVVCEKPLAFDAEGAARMAAAVEAAGVASHVGLILRAMPQVLLTRHLLTETAAGRPLTIAFRDDQFIPVQGYYDSTWRADPARAGRGTMLEHSIHDVDVIAQLAGPVRRVSGVVREVHGLDRIDDLAVARLDLDTDAVATLTSIWHDIVERPSQRHVEVFAERLVVTLDGTPEGVLTWQHTGESPQALQGRALAERCAALGLGRAADIVEVGTGAMFNPLTPFLEAVRDGTPPPLPLRSAVDAHAVVDAIYRSADLGGETVEVSGPS
jgi:predicted dehydrogenase